MISRRKLCTPIFVSSRVVNPLASPPSLSDSMSSSSVSSMSSLSLPFFHHQMVGISMSSSLADLVRNSFTSNEPCRRTAKCIDLLANVLSGYDPATDDYRLLLETVRTTALLETNIYRLSIAWAISDLSTESSVSLSSPVRLRFHMCTRARRKHRRGRTQHHDHKHQTKSSKRQHEKHVQHSLCEPFTAEEDVWPNQTTNWLSDRLTQMVLTKRHYLNKHTVTDDFSEWSDIFFDCDDSKWIIAYRALIVAPLQDVALDEASSGDSSDTILGDMAWFQVKGVITAHVDVTQADINQCEDPNKEHHSEHSDNHLSDQFSRNRVQRDRQLVSQSRQQQPQLVTQAESEGGTEIELSEAGGSYLELTTSAPQMGMESTTTAGEVGLKELDHLHPTQSVEKLPSWIVLNLYGTHKCHIDNSKVSRVDVDCCLTCIYYTAHHGCGLAID